MLTIVVARMAMATSWLAALSLCASAATVSGKIVDITRTGVPGATVLVIPSGEEQVLVHRTTTDSNGSFLVTGLSSGEYVVHVDAPGFLLLDTRFMSDGGDVKIPDLFLQIGREAPTCGSHWARPTIRFVPETDGMMVTGTVERAERVPLQNATATLESPGKAYSSKAAGKGDFQIRGIDPGLYTLIIHAPGFADFVLDPVEVKPRNRTVILDVLRVHGCPERLQCSPVTRIEVSEICF